MIFEYGLPVPGEALRLTGTPEAPRLVTIKTGIDHTEGKLRWAKKKLAELEARKVGNMRCPSFPQNAKTGRPCRDESFIKNIEGLLERRLTALPRGMPGKRK